MDELMCRGDCVWIGTRRQTVISGLILQHVKLLREQFGWPTFSNEEQRNTQARCDNCGSEIYPTPANSLDLIEDSCHSN
jgi:hypothetical protein